MAPARSSIRSALYLTGKPREELDLERGLITAIAVFRWLTWAWLAIVLTLDIRNAPSVARPGAGIALAAAALAWTGAASVLVRTGPSRLLDRWAIAIELAIAAALLFGDWWVYGADNGHSQSLGSAWPLAVILTVGVAYNAWAGFATGFALGIIHIVGQVLFDGGLPARGDDRVGAVGGIVFYCIAGAIAGFVTVKLRQTEREIAVARAREEVSRTLHDGVLQTLAIVQRRATDDDLVALAREQEHELREFLFGTRSDPKRMFRAATSDLPAALRATTQDIERKYGLRAQVVLTEDPAAVPDTLVAALTGAVGEALTNAAKHGGAHTATVFLEPADDGGLFCSVKDDGCGFAAHEVPEGVGTTRSIRGRIADVGGTVEIDGRPGRGTEVRLWVPT
jgi:signal transduction histidine kinase